MYSMKRKQLAATRAGNRLLRRGAASAITALLILMAGRPAAAYRTNSELPDFAGTERVRWNRSTLVFRVVDLPVTNVSTSATSQAVQSALSAWNALACRPPALTLLGPSTFVAAPGDGSNSVQWVTEDWQQDPNAPAYADVQFERDANSLWQIAEADIYLNAVHEVFQARPGTGHLPAIVAHELGHALGLLHPCEIDGISFGPPCEGDVPAAALMYPVYALDRPATPSEDDAAGLCFLYESKPDSVVEATPVTTQCVADTDCIWGFRCVAGECAGGNRALGDPCTLAGECHSAACAGFCSVACSLDSDCETGELCQQDGQLIGACVGVKIGFSGPCSQASDCLSGHCLAGAAGGPVCTSECVPGGTCPLDWVCDHAAPGGKRVCAPPLPEAESGCGCAVVGDPPRRANWALNALVFAALAGGGLGRSKYRRGFGR